MNADGYCVITDEDDDKAMLVWRCKGRERCEGTAEYFGGTGKYAGLKGSHTFYAEPVPKNSPEASFGYSVWKGEWQLPE